MNTKFLLSPAYLASVGAMLVGALLAGTDYMMIGWIIFIIGLALNAMSLVVLANREQLHRASTVGVLPRAHKPAQPAQDSQSTQTAQPAQSAPDAEDAPAQLAYVASAKSQRQSGNITDSHRIFRKSSGR